MAIILFLLPIHLYSQENRIEEGTSSPWQTQIVSQAIALDQLFGPPQNTIKKRELSLWRASKTRPTGQINAAATQDVTRSVTRLSPIPLQLEGFPAIQDDNTATPPDPAVTFPPRSAHSKIRSTDEEKEKKDEGIEVQ